MKNLKHNKYFRYTVQYTILILVSLTTIFPLIWMFGTSFKGQSDSVMSFLPSDPNWDNYIKVFSKTSFGRYYLNSIIITAIVTIGQLLTSSMAGYAFARLRFPGRDKIFFAYLATMMIPGAVTMVPLFMMMTTGIDALSNFLGINLTESLHLGSFYAGRLFGMDSYLMLIAPRLFSPFGVFLMRQFFLNISHEIDEAAEIDGCSTFQIYWHVMLPLATPALGALSIFTFMSTWGDFLWPLIITQSDVMKTLPVGIAGFLGENSTDWPLLMSAATLNILPLLIVFILFQRFFVSGIQMGSVKG